MRNSITLLLLIFVACNPSQPLDKKQNTSLDTNGKVEPPQKPIAESSYRYKPLTAKKELVAIWTSDNKEPLTINITSDSIYYTEHFESHKYSLKGDSIFISYPDFTFAAKVYFSKDTLVMESEDGRSKYVKFNE